MRNQPVSPKTPDSSLVAGDLDGAWSICVVAQKEPQSEQNMTFRTVDMCGRGSVWNSLKSPVLVSYSSQS